MSPDRTYEPFPLIELSGPPFERGRHYGLAARERIGRSIALYSGRLSAMGHSTAFVRDAVAELLPSIERFEPAYLEEMRGIADGAGEELAAVVLINARTEVLQLGMRQAIPEDGCTGAVMLGPATADGRVIHGQNWDWRAECIDTAVVLRIRREGGPDILTFTEAGGLARSGLNGAGLGITANYLESDRDGAQRGIPLPFIRRKALEAADLATAIRVVATTPKSVSNNMMLSHASGFGVDFECAPDEAFALLPERGLLIHANHWVSQAARAKLKEMGLADMPDSLYRDWRVRQILERDHGRLDREHLRAAFLDDFGSPYAVCRPPSIETDGNLGATVAMILMQPGEGLMEITPMPALNRTSRIYRLSDAAHASKPPAGVSPARVRARSAPRRH